MNCAAANRIEGGARDGLPVTGLGTVLSGTVCSNNGHADPTRFKDVRNESPRPPER